MVARASDDKSDLLLSVDSLSRHWGCSVQIDILVGKHRPRGRAAMEMARNYGDSWVRSMSRGRRLRYAILDNHRSSASLGEPTIQCYGSSPYPIAHFPRILSLENVETDIEIQD